MTKTPTDYSKSLIYKLCSNDTDITDIYVGSTTNFNYRKYNHKSCCYNEKNRSYNYNLYKFIRENGGWEEWNMILIEYYPCKTKLELEKKEREIIENLKSTLNNAIPTRTIKEWREENKEYMKKQKEYKLLKVECECGVIILKSHIVRHKQSKKHQNYINALHS